MKNHYFLLVILLCTSGIQVFSQGKLPTAGSPTPLDCAHHTRHEQLLLSDPAYAAAVNQINQNAIAYAAGNLDRNDDDIFTIPVVVHVIHLGEPVGTGTNISDEQIFSAIVALNNDFRKTPGTVGDAGGVDTKLQFCLAMRNPQNQTHSGINRVDGRTVALYETQGISAGGAVGASETAVKALSTWPREQYVNIWLVSEIENNDGGGGVQGYAYFPTNSPLDGIVLLHNVFGTVGNVKPTHNLSRTATHEMGHTFALYHTFHSTNNCNPETDCTLQGDRVCDTPTTIQNSNCSNPACSGTQQVNNYLDYTSQTCRNMFSEGQKDRMRSTLFNERASLMTSLGCTPVSNFDIGVTNVSQPSGNSCNASVTPVVTITNFGTTTITSTTVSYNISGMVFGTFNWTGSLASGANTQVTLPPLVSPFGTHTLMANTLNPNGQSDQNQSNDSGSGVFTIVNGTTLTITANLDFFGGQNSWQIKNGALQVVASGGPYPNNQQGVVHTHTTCLPEGCYTFHFFDTGGNGMSFLAGSYSLTAPGGTVLASGSGNFGASQVTNFCVSAPSAPATPTAGFTQSSTQICQSGSVSFTNQSTGSPTSYAWTFAGGTPSTSTATNPTVTYGSAGNYTVTLTATNANGSNTSAQTNLISVLAAPSVNPTTGNVTCNGAANGTASLAISGAGAPYSTSWSNGMNGSSISGLAPGNYTATTNNSANCSTQTTISITQPSALTATATATQITCNSAANGSATATASGGTGNKTFSWSNGQTGATANNLAPGTYTVTATDANGCTAQASVSITQPSALTASATATQITCNGAANGSATATASGGTGTKTFTWSNGQTGATANNLAPGTYTVTATDANGCTAQSSVTVTQPSALTASATATQISCNGLANGSATATASGGTGSKTFSWSNGQSGATVNNLAPGTFTVTATDANGCTSQASVTITQPSVLTASVTATQITCNGSANGSATATASGGTGSKTFSWSNGQVGSTVGNLAPGTFTVTTTDANGCTVQNSVSITQPTLLTTTTTATQITCGATDNGIITASATGGTGTKTFSWSTGQTGATINNLAPGEYFVTATDANGCTSQSQNEIFEPEGFSISATKTNVTCNGAANGTATVTPSGGNLPIIYQWTNGQTGAVATDLSPGVHTVNATDAGGCTAQTAVSITQPTAVTTSATAVQITCNGANNGSATATASGGTGTKTFAWSTGQTGATAGNLPPGAHTVTATDANGCTAQSTVTITQPSALTITVTANQITCNGANNGSATATVSGGTGNKTLSWSNGQSGAIANNLAPGTFTVTATDANNCSTQAAVTITQPSVLTASATATQVTCASASIATATVTASGGTGSKTFLWSNGQTTATATGLGAGTISVTVTDQNNCSVTTSATVTQNSNLAVNMTTSNVTCSGLSNGSASATATGGTAPLSYSWSNGSTGQSIQNLPAGNYTLTVTDAAGCSFSSAAVISQAAALVVTTSATQTTCAGVNNASINAIATGGTGGKTFAWSTGQSGATISNLAPGTYTVTATDANGCSAQTSTIISQPQPLQLNVSTTSVTCGATGNGTATAAASGGTGTISTIWSTGQSGSTINGLSAGTYTVTATDINGCSTQATFVIDPPTEMSLTATGTNVSCHGLSNGTATALVSNGSAPVNYLWSNGQTGPSATGLAPGVHTVTATDAAGCSAQASVPIIQPGVLNVSATAVQVTCNGANNGSATAVSSGGTGTKTFAWSNGQTGPSISGLAPGTFTVTVTDVNSCSNQTSVNITQPSALGLGVSAVGVACFGGNNGSATATLTGGSGNINFLWSNGQTASSISNLTAGSYTVTATDQNGCTEQASTAVGTPTELTANVTATSVACFGGANGSASVSIAGGTAPYQTLWSNGLSGPGISSLPSGMYTATITDVNGCVAQDAAQVTQPAVLNVQTSVTNVTCFDESNGTATVSSTGGTLPVVYTWSNGQSGPNASNLAEGNHSVITTDINGCTVTTDVVVTQPQPIQIMTTSGEPSCFGQSDGTLSVAASGGNGTITYAWSTQQTESTISGLSAGTYGVIATDQLGCSSSALATISQPAPLNVQLGVFNISCGNAGSGSAMAQVSGGSQPYNYQWSNGNQGESTEGLIPGLHSVLVTDNNGCSFGTNFEITESDGLSIALFSQNPLCFGQNSGEIQAMAGGGSGPYLYLWNTGSTSAELMDLSAGTYSVIAVDQDGCQGQVEVTLSEPPLFTVTALVTSPETCDQLGQAIATASGGVGGYGYEWSNGTLNQELEASSGSYVVVARDGNLCQATASAFIPNDCQAPIPTTFLNETSCGITELDFSSVIECIPVPDAELYLWTFENIENGLSQEAYTAGNNPSFHMFLIPELQYGMVVEVGVKARVNGEWGPDGPTCLVGLTSQLPTSQLTSSWCNATSVLLGETLEAVTIQGAAEYEWTFTSATEVKIYNTFISQFNLSVSQGFAEGTSYEVKLKVRIGSLWSDFGTACQITTASGMGIADISDENTNIFPNPFDGRAFYIEFGNELTGDVTLELYTSGGKLVAKEILKKGTVKKEVTIENRLATGLYVIKLRMNGAVREFKSIVQY